MMMWWARRREGDYLVLGGLIHSLPQHALPADAVKVKVLEGVLLGLAGAECLQVRLRLCKKKRSAK